MVKFYLLTIFPKIFDSYLNESIIKRAQATKKINIEVVNIRSFSRERHQKTDYKPYGGGPGLVMFVEPIVRAVSALKAKLKTKKTKVVIFTPGGKQFTNDQAIAWSKKYEAVIMICGRYEGIDARVKKILRAEEVSIGPFVLTGGELPALVLTDAMARQIPGVLGNELSPEEKRVSAHEVYTRPEVFAWRGKKYRVPKVLLSGHHQKIDEWKQGK